MLSPDRSEPLPTRAARFGGHATNSIKRETYASLSIEVRNELVLEVGDHVLDAEFAFLEPPNRHLVRGQIVQARNRRIQVAMLRAQLHQLRGDLPGVGRYLHSVSLTPRSGRRQRVNCAASPRPRCVPECSFAISRYSASTPR